MKKEVLSSNYKETLNLIIQEIKLAQQKAIISANITLLDLYWDIGNILVNKKIFKVIQKYSKLKKFMLYW